MAGFRGPKLMEINSNWFSRMLFQLDVEPNLYNFFIHTGVKVDGTHVLVYVSPVLTYLLRTISRLAMYFDYGVFFKCLEITKDPL